MSNITCENSSDDEVFFGKFTLKEVKKRLNVKNIRQTICSSTFTKDDVNTSIQIIEQNSEPNLIVPESPENTVTSVLRSSVNSETGEDSFLLMEKMVSELEISSEKKIIDDLDNTMEVIDSILKSGKAENDTIQQLQNVKQEADMTLLLIKSDTNDVPSTNTDTHTSSFKEPLSPASHYCTPIKEDKKLKTEVFSTPSNKLIETKSPYFKTPAKPLSSKKPSCTSLKKTPLKSSSYQHIASPIAAYIKNSPQVPLIQNVRPKKPLPSCSSIPKLVKPKSSVTKENYSLPSLAYKSAKTTKVIDLPEKDKLPQSQWAKKITSSLPKPMVLKHDRREMNLCRTPFHCNQEDSFANLSLRQADVSVCTQKSAFDQPKKLPLAAPAGAQQAITNGPLGLHHKGNMEKVCLWNK